MYKPNAILGHINMWQNYNEKQRIICRKFKIVVTSRGGKEMHQGGTQENLKVLIVYFLSWLIGA